MVQVKERGWLRQNQQRASCDPPPKKKKRFSGAANIFCVPALFSQKRSVVRGLFSGRSARRGLKICCRVLHITGAGHLPRRNTQNQPAVATAHNSACHSANRRGIFRGPVRRNKAAGYLSVGCCRRGRAGRRPVRLKPVGICSC